MMKEEVKTKWVEALRSDEYTQGTGQLVDTIDGKDRFCCLGVLCDIYRKEVGGEWKPKGALCKKCEAGQIGGRLREEMMKVVEEMEKLDDEQEE